MKLLFNFFLFLFSLDCFSLERQSPELVAAYKKFELAHSEYPNISTFDDSTIGYFVTDRMHQMPHEITLPSPHGFNGFKWSSSKMSIKNTESYSKSLNTYVTVHTNIKKYTLRNVSNAPCGNLAQIKKCRPKIWLMHYTSKAASQVLADYYLLWVERGLYTEEEWTAHIENLLHASVLQSCPPEKLTLGHFEFLGAFMSEQIRQETFSSAAH